MADEAKRDTLTLLYGVSGLGKTSLLQAGLFPALRAEDYLPVPIRLDYVDGAIPPAVVFGHRGFLAAAEGLKPAGGRHLLQYAADLARSPDGHEHDVSGVYREVVPGEKLVFTWAWRSTPERESLVTIELKPDGAGTLLTLTHEQFFDADARDRHQRGWEGALTKLEAFLG